MRSVSRIMDCSINTVTTLLVETGKKCFQYQNTHLVNLPCRRIEVDEIWSFVYSKQKTKSPKAPIDAHGNIWTWTALCPETKLIATWLVGDRSQEAAYDFIEDLSKRFSGRIQLTSDGYKAYTEPVHASFGNRIDYAQYVKKYDHNNKFIGADKKIILGNPDPKFINTTYVERQNLTMRTCIRRFARQTNAFSKKLENHSHALALYFMHYNFCRIHKTLRVTPAMEAGLTNHVWMIEELLSLS